MNNLSKTRPKLKGKLSRVKVKPTLLVDGAESVYGYGSPELRIEAIEPWLCRTIIAAKHYSKRWVNNGYIHLGVYHHRRLVGVMQWGYALVPNSGRRVVKGTGNKEYLELNRLWLHDQMPKNSESRAISYALKYIKKAYPQIKWVQSFADERLGGAGIVYQACSFDYIGCHDSIFYELEGEWYHTIAISRKGGKRGEYLQANRERATKHKFKQFRYIKFLHKRERKNLNKEIFQVLPYPKPS